MFINNSVESARKWIMSKIVLIHHQYPFQAITRTVPGCLLQPVKHINMLPKPWPWPKFTDSMSEDW